MSNINIACDFCGVNFEKEKKNVTYNKKKNYKNYCSKKCMAASRVTSLHISCNKCGKKVIKTKSTANRSRSGYIYCSRSCANGANNTLHRSGKNHPNFKGGGASYRQKALNFFGMKCALCDYSNVSALEVHHKDKNRKNNDISNLVVLCRNHHREAHVLPK